MKDLSRKEMAKERVQERRLIRKGFNVTIVRNLDILPMSVEAKGFQERRMMKHNWHMKKNLSQTQNKSCSWSPQTQKMKQLISGTLTLVVPTICLAGGSGSLN